MIDFKLAVAEILGKQLTTPPTMEIAEIAEMLELPPESKMGDFAFPCFKLAKTMRKAPNMIAKELAANIQGEAMVERAESAGGYVNFFMSKEAVISEVLCAVKAQNEKYGSSILGNGKKVIVEFSSPNIAKPFHIGHIRSTVIGNAIDKIYAFMGYETIRINHLGDYGTQFGKMIVAYKKWGKKEDVEKEPINTLLGLYVKFHEEVENDSSLEDEARAVFKRLEDGGEEEQTLWKWFREASLTEFERVYQMLGISFDSYAGESFYSDKMKRITDELEEKNLLEKSNGAEIVDLEAFGMSPALIRKSDGSTLYITRDIAAAVYRKEHYHFDKNIYVVASQQNLHFQQWFQIIEMMGYDWADQCVHVPFGLVSLEEGTMSTRKGRVVFLEEVLKRAILQTKEIIKEKHVAQELQEEVAKQVGIGAVIFQELSNGRIKDYVFSWDKVLNFEGETGPYVQYTHARACSVLRNAKVSIDENISYEHLNSEAAYHLAKLIYRFPEIVAEAAEKYEPSIVTRHIVDIAQGFNKFYHDEHILVSDEAEQKSKLLLVYAAKQTIKNGLTLLGMEAPERM